ncbi:hypothetical protein V8C37DRAFT_397495 [Trichoderma ceciliae]
MAMKEKTIRAAFKKTGIHPFNAQIVVKSLIENQRPRTPEPIELFPNALIHSSPPMHTPYTSRQVNLLGNSVKQQYENGHISEEAWPAVANALKGLEYHATKSIQFERTEKRRIEAAKAQKTRRASRHRQIRSSGPISIENARHIFFEKDAMEEAKIARKVVRKNNATINKAKKALKRMEIDARKIARASQL